ncbi:protein-glutamate O-methyltransferase CheR [Sphingomonas sp.]|uniref:CheR family methyltransferase n=1 Tax=Sphingomonas sp. TaxID=28214 RepID=UPI001E185E34|nr:protein-glutamate O-methyltransferase CheR [Sphingomonas sp.]MBX9797130.1 protein-glutamate O-methyltransferase CheR [Sphingomonas sp.]
MNMAASFDRLPGVSAGVYAEADFDAVRALLYKEAGIVLPPGKAMLVYSRLAPLVRGRNCGTFANYIKMIEHDAEERRKAVCALTTNHTFFFREEHHFEHFAAEARPQLVARANAGQPVRIWSAGCSSGEETWSIALTLLGADRGEGRRIAGQDVVILASDLADHALAAARAARYPAAAVDPVPAPLREAWMQVGGDTATVSPEVTRMVRFRTLNLLGAWPMQRRFDVIFCRNVMIYFDQPTKETLVSRFAEQLNPGGLLYIGHSERVTGAAARVLRPIGNTIYRKEAA